MERRLTRTPSRRVRKNPKYIKKLARIVASQDPRTDSTEQQTRNVAAEKATNARIPAEKVTNAS